MVEPITAATSLALGGGGVYLLLKQWRLRNQRLRAKALLEKYGTRTQLHQQSGRMRLIFNNPQVGDLPSSEQEAWQERDEQRDRSYVELDLIQPSQEDPGESEEERASELERRHEWISSNEPPMQEHAALVAEEEIGSGVAVADPAEELDTAIDERLEREGGASGVVQISLAWDDYNDLDLHLFCPSGERIYFNNKRSECGGILDVDMNVRPLSNTPVENVVWKDIAPLGAYKEGVHFYKHHRKRKTKRVCTYRLRVITHGRAKEYVGKIKYGQAMQMVTSFTLASTK